MRWLMHGLIRKTAPVVASCAACCMVPTFRNTSTGVEMHVYKDLNRGLRDWLCMWQVQGVDLGIDDLSPRALKCWHGWVMTSGAYNTEL